MLGGYTLEINALRASGEGRDLNMFFSRNYLIRFSIVVDTNSMEARVSAQKCFSMMP